MEPFDTLIEVTGTPCEREADRVARALIQSCRGRELAHRPTTDHHAEAQPLSPDLRDFFSRRLGYDLAGVRVHADERAARLAHNLGAEAFARSSDIFFATGRYDPSTPSGLELLAHELIHVVQQRGVPRCGDGEVSVLQRVPTGVQRSVNPQRLYSAICPDGSDPLSYPSSGPVGTAYGKWLGLMYMRERNPQTYGLVDFWVYEGRGSGEPGTIYDLLPIDPYVYGALLSSEWSRRGLQRTDILNADAELAEVYEIKPVRSADAGPDQLARYLKALNKMAPMTSPAFGPPRPRVWQGGDWDPSPHRLVIPSADPERSCFIHAWQDPAARGLILYDIVCCRRRRRLEEQPELVPMPLTRVVGPLREIQPALERTLQATLPLAPADSTYVVLATPRFFDAFVKGVWERDQDRLLAKYGPRLSPVFMQFVLQTFLLARILPTGFLLADVAAISTGFLSKEQVLQLWKVDLAVAALGTAAAFAIYGAWVALPQLLPAIAGAAPWVGRLGGEAARVGALTSGAPLASGQALAVTTGQAAVGASLLNGSSALLTIGRSAAPWAAEVFSSGPGAGVGLGLLGAFAIAVLPAEAQAAPDGSVNPPPQILESEPIYLAPAEVLIARRGKIELGAEVRCGQDKYYIIGLVGASVPT